MASSKKKRVNESLASRDEDVEAGEDELDDDDLESDDEDDDDEFVDQVHMLISTELTIMSLHN